MAEEKRLSKVARELNVGASTIVDFLTGKGYVVENNPNSKISVEQQNILLKEFESSAMDKQEASSLTIGKKEYAGDNKYGREDEEDLFLKSLSKETVVDKPKAEAPVETPAAEKEESIQSKPKLQGIKVLGKIDLDKKPSKPVEKQVEPPVEIPNEEPAPTPVEEEKVIEPEVIPLPVVAEAPVIEEEEAVVEEEEYEEEEVEEEEEEVEEEEVPEIEATENKVIEAKAEQLKGLTVLGKIELPQEKAKKKAVPPVASSDAEKDKKKLKRKRKRVRIESKDERPKTPANNTTGGAGEVKKDQQPSAFNRFNNNRPGGPNKAPFDNRRKPVEKEEVSDKQIQDQIKATLAKLSGGGGKGGGQVNRAKYRREKRSAIAEANEEKMLQAKEDAKILKVTEFISANDLASLMEVSVNEVISVCMGLGMFVSINQRLDAEAITVIADEFGYNVDFTSSDEESGAEEELEDDPADLIERAPIVTIMGHVDHGKTSLLDYIRKSRVTSQEAGGITQHIGAYDVTTDSGKRIAFLDTPGHEAFTAMRARGAKVTDIVIIVVAADDNVMPQTKEAINHAQVAQVPIVIAINKVDKPSANPDKIREELAQLNILVEEWGGKYQCQEISAKTGQGIKELLEKVLLEAELLELKANPNKNAVGTVIEASLDKGRGYVTTVLVQAGSLKVGDVLLAGSHFGKVKAMMDHRGVRIKKAIPSTPIQVLGLDGAPQAGDKFQVLETEREAREIATKREQIQREQTLRTKKHITLDEIGRRLAIGSFKQLNVIVKGDVDGSVEALSDSLLKLSFNEIQISIIHKAVGQISESDVLLASAADAIIVGFQVRPSQSARKLAEAEQIEIRLYSIIYDAINEIKDAMEGMLAPKFEEVIVGNVEVREVFKISKVGTIAGCYVTEGYIKRNNKIRVIRDGIVLITGDIDQLKRFKDDVSEVRSGFECGISVKGFNDIEIGDNIESFEQKEVKRNL